MFRVIATDAVEPPDRFAFWSEESMRSGGWTFRAEDRSHGSFGATVDAALLGDAVLLRQAASPYAVTCGPKEVARSHEPNVLLVAHRSGTVHYHHGHAKIVARAGDLVVTDMTRPMSAEVSQGGCRTFSVRLPYHRLQQTLHGRSHAPVVKLGGGPGRLDLLLGSYLDGLERLAPDVLVAQGATFADHLRELVALALSDTPLANERAEVALKAVRLDAVLRFVETRLADPELEPAIVAARFGISLRYLHKLFESTGRTFSEHVAQSRLERCRAELIDPHHDTRTIADICLGWGFNSFSHFSRRFREAFGVSPRETRRAARADRSRDR